MPFKMRNTLLGSTIVGILMGCASPKSQYQWSTYQNELRHQYDGKSAEEQILALEDGLVRIAERGQLPPPGYHAHVGLLYIQNGQTAFAIRELKSELRLFPESSTYINFLLEKINSQ